MRLGTSGAFLGLSGEELRALWMGWAIGAVISGLVCVFDVLTEIHDSPALGVARPLLLEATSYLFVVLVLPLPGLAYLWSALRRLGPWRAAGVHLVAAALYFIVHVSGFTVLRAIAFPLLLHVPYEIHGPSPDTAYELVRDLLAYGISVLLFRMLVRWIYPAEPVRAGVFDIRDGQRLVRAALDDILAVRSAGNYVEFLLADGRRPLMRTPLAALEAELAGRGFVRTHRSWLVNAGRVTGLRPEGSGDYAVEIGGVEAPLSRRFPKALAALRG